jgi:hypothetical protein
VSWQLNETIQHVERALETFQLALNQSERAAHADAHTEEHGAAGEEHGGGEGAHGGHGGGGGHGGHAEDEVPPVRYR